MPTYEYRCPDCGYEFEKFQPITAAPVKRCPVCGKTKVKRLIGTGAGVIFKGSGFYITDYRSEGYKEKAKAESPSSAEPAKDSKPSGESAGAAESKPAAKSESTAPAKAPAKPAKTPPKKD